MYMQPVRTCTSMYPLMPCFLRLSPITSALYVVLVPIQELRHRAP